MRFFSVWCQRSILPCVCGWYGAPRTWLIPLSVIQSASSPEEAQEVVAAIPEGLDLVENHDYYDGVRFFKGTVSEDALLPRAGLNAKFGVAMFQLFEGHTQKGNGILRELVTGSSQGCWPAETELLASTVSQ